ncbi:MAG TPA: phosphoglycolate phosphatase [Xanthobacteraceae bacterium]|nr:phosphoglycolate phosphatase [Xanthobacteraceae bacterium]
MLTLVFDLDGTLIDTAPDLIDTLNLILAQERLPAMPFEAARKLIGGGARGMIEKALIIEGRDCSKVEIDRMFGAFIAHYAEHIADRSRPFPHLEATLEDLAAQGHRLAVCTNKLEWLSRRLLTTLQLDKYFATICGQDTFAVMKPNPEILRQTIMRAGGAAAQAIMVGDSGTDIRTARAASVPVIAVDFGYTEVPIASLSPDRIISSFNELAEAIGEVSTRRT